MTSFFAEWACQSGDIMCNLRQETANVVLEAALVVVIVGLSTTFWNRVVCQKVFPRKPPIKGVKRLGQPIQHHKSSGIVESKMRAAGPGPVQTLDKFHLLFRSYSLNQDVGGILRTLKIMAQQGIQADDAIFDDIFGRFQTNFNNNTACIIRIFEALVDGGFKPSKTTLSAVVKLLIETEAWEEALKFLRSTSTRFDIPADATQYAKLASMCKTSGGLTTAMLEIHKAMIDDLGETVALAAVEEELASKRCRDCIKAAAPLRPFKPSNSNKLDDQRANRRIDPCYLGFDGEAHVWKRLVVLFAVTHGLDRVKLEMLPSKHLRWMIDQDFFLKGDGELLSTTEVLAARVREAVQKPAEFWASYPTAHDVQKRLKCFVEINNLDTRCTEMMNDLPIELAQKVMDHEFIVKVDPVRGTSSAKVVGHVLRFRRQSMLAAGKL